MIRIAIAAIAIALTCAGIAVSPALDRIHGLSLDILTALRFEMFGNRYNPAAAPTVVVAIDEESYRAAPFKGTPTMTWTGEIGRVLNAIVEGGALTAKGMIGWSPYMPKGGSEAIRAYVVSEAKKEAADVARETA